MAIYTYDTEADVLQVLLVDEDEASIDRTVELAPTSTSIWMLRVELWVLSSSIPGRAESTLE